MALAVRDLQRVLLSEVVRAYRGPRTNAKEPLSRDWNRRLEKQMQLSETVSKTTDQQVLTAETCTTSAAQEAVKTDIWISTYAVLPRSGS